MELDLQTVNLSSISGTPLNEPGVISGTEPERSPKHCQMYSKNKQKKFINNGPKNKRKQERSPKKNIQLKL